MSSNKEFKKNIQKIIPEIIVVEGKTDTQKLQKLFNVRTIETNGSALNQDTIELIKLAAKTSGVILFLDPDYQGNKIRKTIAQHLNSYKECFISKNDIKNNEKIGIAEATDEAIIKALNSYVINDTTKMNNISWSDYLELNLNTKSKRLKLCNLLNIGYANHKQLFKKLNLINISLKELKKLIKEYEIE